jgi:hypothetical protein
VSANQSGQRALTGHFGDCQAAIATLMARPRDSSGHDIKLGRDVGFAESGYVPGAEALVYANINSDLRWNLAGLRA